MFMRLAVSSYSGHLALERAAINQLQTAKLKSIPGEDVVEFTRMYLELSDIPRYGQLGLPADAAVLYVTALSDSSVEKFRSYMNTLYNELALDMTKYSLEDVTSIADQRYHDLVARSQWINGVSGPSFGFTALTMVPPHGKKNSKKDIKDVVCFKCKQKGHYANKCPNVKSETTDKSASENSPSSEDQATKKKPWRVCAPATGSPTSIT